MGNIIFLAIIVLIVVAIVGRDTATVPESAVLTLNPTGVLVEQKRLTDPFQQLFSGGVDEDAETLLRDVTDAIDFAADDDRIKGIVLDLTSLQGGSLSQYEEIGDSLAAFRDADKPVLSFATGYSQSQYYLSAHADELYLDRDSHSMFGGVFITGLGVYPLYFKTALEKLKVKYHVFKAGLYKDAAEVFLRDGMSDYSREATQAYLAIIWDGYISAVAELRDIESSALQTYVDNYDELLESTDLDPALLAEEQGLIDARISRNEWDRKLADLTGGSGDDYDAISFRSYLATQRPPIPVVNPAADKIAIIVAKGTILDGEQPPGDVGGDSMVELIRKAREDRSTKAVVVRIDSPGGSPSASEYIRTELQLTQESGKPVVVSMGGLAASGGYWIAATANKIFATPSTLTGSIGTFASIPTFDASLSELGVYSDGVGTTELAGSFSLYRPLNARFEHFLENSVERTYRKFLELVAEGRGLTVEQVDEIAQGRVWAGETALKLGLVDAIGNIDDAVESAAMLADIDDYEVVYLEKSLSPREEFLRQLTENVVAYLPRSIALQSAVPVIPEELRALLNMLDARTEPAILSQCFTCRIAF